MKRGQAMNKASRYRVALALFLLLVGVLPAITYNRTAFRNQADLHWDNSDPGSRDSRFKYYPCENCAEFASQCQYEGGVPFLRRSMFMIEKVNGEPRYMNTDPKPYPPLIHSSPTLRDFDKSLGGQSEVGYGTNIPGWIMPGDKAFILPDPIHTVVIIDTFTDENGNRDLHWAANCNPHHSILQEDPPCPPFRQFWGDRQVEWVHIPDVIYGCKQPKQFCNLDSTFGNKMQSIWKWICCWHEQYGSPWTANPSFYACLNWDVTSGTTWDTMVSPRFNLAGCSSVVFKQWSTSTLQHGSNKVIQIRGSTNDGATWPYLLSSDSLTEASLTWATNQRNVRIAWIYKGPVQSGRYWAVDDLEILAKPSLERDLCVSEVKWPKGIITQGKIVKPAVWVWNSGSALDSAWVTFRVGSVYGDSEWVRLWPYSDRLLEFGSWNAVPGNYTSTCFVEGASDQLRGNDTAVLAFRVVADTWVRMYPVYGGHGMSGGACMATVDSNTIFCAPGYASFFAKYLVWQDLWKTRCNTPVYFGSGAGLAYPGGDYLYALRGSVSKTFVRYRISTNQWSFLADVPNKVSLGGGLAYGGNGRTYALRGSDKKDFYRYTIASNSWQAMAQAPGRVGCGGALVWTGGDYLYALRGSGECDFYRYQISTDQWTSRASLPAAVRSGGSLAYNPVTGRIYAFLGNGTYYFYAYNITSNTWSSRRCTPAPVRNGGCLTYCDYSVFGGLGTGQDDDFWRYSPPVGGFEGEGESIAAPVDSRNMVHGDVLGIGTDDEGVLTSGTEDKFTPLFSSDGKSIIYIGYDSLRDCLTPYRIPTGGGQPAALTADSTTYENPRLSPDGNWLVMSGDSGIYRAKACGPSAPQLLASGTDADPAWTSDGSWAVYSKWDSLAQSQRLYRVPASGGMEECLTPNPGGYLQPQSMSPVAMVCVKLKGEVYQLCRIMGGNESWLTSDYMDNVSPRLSPDCQHVTYQKFDESGHWQVYTIRLDGQEETRITDGTCDCLTPVFAPDNIHVAYSKWPVDATGSSEYSQICYATFNQPGSEVALTAADAVRETPAWSPNCSFITHVILVDLAPLDGKKEKHRQVARVRTHIQFSGTEAATGIPKAFALYQNHPNPFSTRTAIRYAVPWKSFVDLVVYDVTGRVVNRLVSAELRPGYYTTVWHGEDARGRRLPSGAYYYMLRADKKLLQKRMLLVR